LDIDRRLNVTNGWKGRIMSVGFALLIFAGAATSQSMAVSSNAAPTEAQVAPDSHSSYAEAYRVAQRTKRPMLVILNPAKDSKISMVSFEDVKKTRARRDLLQNYVVAVIDTSTPYGQKVYEAFGSPQLPRVTNTDSDLQYQVYQTSEALYGQQWDTVLTTFVHATPVTVMPAPNYCPYCQQH
jgi:hypothetical protein